MYRNKSEISINIISVIFTRADAEDMVLFLWIIYTQ